MWIWTIYLKINKSNDIINFTTFFIRIEVAYSDWCTIKSDICGGSMQKWYCNNHNLSIHQVIKTCEICCVCSVVASKYKIVCLQINWLVDERHVWFKQCVMTTDDSHKAFYGSTRSTMHNQGAHMLFMHIRVF